MANNSPTNKGKAISGNSTSQSQKVNKSNKHSGHKPNQHSGTSSASRSGNSSNKPSSEASTPSQKQKRPRRSRWLRFITWAFATLLLLLLLLGVLASWLLYTDSGLRFALNTAEDVTGGALQTTNATGRLAGPLQIEQLSYQDDTIDFQGENLVFDWLPAALFRGTAQINTVQAGRLELTLGEFQEPDEPNEPIALPDIDLPLGIELAQLNIKQFVLHQGDIDHVIEDIVLEAGTSGRRVDLRTLTLTYNNMPFELDVAGNVELGDQYPLDIVANWHLLATDQYPSYKGVLSANGTLGELLKGDLVISEPSTVKLVYEVSEPLQDVTWQTALTIDSYLLNRWWPELPAFALGATAQATGDAEQASIQSLVVETLDGTLTATGQVGWAQQVAWDLQLKARNIDPSGFDPELAGNLALDAEVVGQLDAQGQPDLTVRLSEIDSRITGYDGQIPVIKGNAVARLQGEQLTIESLTLETLEGTIKASGDANLATPLQWNVKLDARNINPEMYSPELAGSVNLDSVIAGKITAQNTPELTATINSLDGELRGLDGQVPEFSGSGVLSLRDNILNIERFVLNTLGGSIQTTGTAQLAEPLSWQALLQVKSIDLGRYNPELNGELSLELTTDGQIADDTLVINGDIQKLDGRWRGRQVTGGGEVAYANDWLDVNQLRLRSDDASINANGRVKLEQPFSGDLDFSANIPDLSAWVPDMQGQIELSGSLLGNNQALRLQTDVAAAEIEYAEYDIETLTAVIDVDLNGQAASTATVTVADSELSGMQVQQATLALSGTAKQHTVELETAMQEGSTKLVVTGGATGQGDTLFTQGWQGVIQTANLDTKDLANWRLNEPLNLSVRTDGPNQGVVLERGCFASDANQSEICMGGRYSDRSGANFSGTIVQVPLRLVEPFMPPEYKLIGVLNGQFDFLAPNGQQPKGEIAITSADGAIQTRLNSVGQSNDEDGEQATAFDYSNLELIGRMQNGEFRMTGGVDLAKDGEAKAVAEINIRLEDEMPIDGRITADINRLTGVSIFVPQLTNVKGNAEIDIQLAGTVSAPQFDGFLEIDAQQADVIPLGAQINDLYARVEANGSGKISLLGEFLAGGGALDFRGEVQAVDNGWQGELKVQGEKVELLRTPDMRGKFSPDLLLKVNGNELAINGELKLYETELELKRFSSVTRESNDVIIVGELPVDDEQEEPLELTGSVSIVTGDPIRVLADGLEASVDGQLRLALQPEGLPIGRGELAVEGKFEAYGQDLSIENSRIIFADTVVSNPRLSVEAVRRVEAVTVGVKVTGAAENPRVEIFSRPAMTESEALAYLVLGRPLEDASSTEGNSLNNAAAALGAAGGNILGDWVGTNFGIDNVGFESDGEQVDFVLGTQLGEQLYVNFRQGLFEPISALQLQYILNERCTLEAETSSNGQGVDMKCRFERD